MKDDGSARTKTKQTNLFSFFFSFVFAICCNILSISIRCSQEEASCVIRFMFSKLVECNALMVDLSQQAKRSLAGLRSSYEESQKRFDAYRRQERDRTQDLMLKCTDILNREHRHGQDRRQQHASSSAQASPQKRRRKIV